MVAMTDTPAAFAALSYFDTDDVYLVTRITAGAIGDPRQHYFILQAHIGDEPVSWVIEKEQALQLSRKIPQLLADIRAEFPELGEPLIAAEPNLALTEPWQALFRVGSLGVSYDRLHDLVVLELVDADVLEALQSPADITGDYAEQFVHTTRGQALLLARQAEKIVAAGRPNCPVCGEPMDDFGHFCLPARARERRTGDYVH